MPSPAPPEPLTIPSTRDLNATRKQKFFLRRSFYGRAFRWAVLSEIKSKGPRGEVRGTPVGPLDFDQALEVLNAPTKGEHLALPYEAFTAT